MPAQMPEPLERHTFDANRLMAEHPPILRHTNKLVVYTTGCPEGCTYDHELGYSRWGALQLPERVRPAEALQGVLSKQTIFDYQPAEDLPNAVAWYVNFADPLLFYAYGSGLFAQDEMQTAEHPVLGALVEALHVGADRAVTEDDSGPTPVLITGAERRVHIATDRNEAEGRPRGLYGNEFSAAAPDVIRRATKRLDPPTVTNVIAMAAPAYGIGKYTREQMERILVTAYTGFAAAANESSRIAPGAPVVVHTGYWGCGVFGGCRKAMSLLQLLAAEMAGVDRVVFHTVSEEGAPAFEQSLQILRDELAPLGEITTHELLDRLVAMNFAWGMSECC